MALIFFYASTAILLLYTVWQLINLRAWQKTAASPPSLLPPDRDALPSIALLVPFRNEAQNLPRLSASLLAQDYPGQLGLIFIDDHSTDGGAELLPNEVTLLKLRDYLKGEPTVAHKKAALTYAIASTKADIIITTDADCHWPADRVSQIAAAFTDGAEIVLGPVLIAPANGFCNAFQALDLAAYQFLTAATAQQGRPALANGANFAFRRELFNAVGGYRGVDHLPSGDDVLLLHKFYQPLSAKALDAGNRASSISPVSNAGNHISPIANRQSHISPASDAGNRASSISPVSNAGNHISPIANRQSHISPASDAGNRASSISPVSNAGNHISPIANRQSHISPASDAGNQASRIETASGNSEANRESHISPPTTRYTLNASITTNPVNGWKALWRQRLRWAGKAGNYNNPKLSFAQALAFALSAAIVLSFVTFPLHLRPRLIIMLWGGKALIDLVCLWPVMKHFGQAKTMKWYPAAAIIYPFFLFGVGTAALLGFTTKWKGRQ